jgi:multicomponent Na+:H+ antiporter subunit B
MSRALRSWVLAIGLAGVAALLVGAFLDLPAFGTADHPYRDAAVAAAVARASPNVISSINFDQRALDTLIEETILFGSVVAVAALLRPSEEEHLHRPEAGRGPLEGTRAVGYLMLPLTLVVGVDVVVHGHLTPGGGFQGGVVLATGWHLLYISGSHPALAKLRPIDWCEYAEAAATGLYVVTGLTGLVAGGAFLANVLPPGEFGSLLSAGTVPVLSLLIGIEVAAGLVVLLARFLGQGLIREEDS